MRNLIKKNLIAVFALLLGIGTMSFKLTEKNMKSLDEQWYYTPEITGAEGSPSSYERAGSHPNCPGNTDVWCLIEAPEFENSGQPDLSNVTEPLSYKQ